MGYKALERMRKQHKKLFGADVGPFAPEHCKAVRNGFDLRSAALRFLHERCEDLRFDEQRTKQEAKPGVYLGTGIRPNQVPYNMQMDVERLCLANELGKFIDSGVAEDAYTVYYAYLEMFIGGNGQSQKMVELLSEFESNASTLLMKHRDHYSHSVYVFALGLAIYETSEAFRSIFNRFYGFGEDRAKEAAAFFLEFWGLTSLFHDIGYPFEIPFEQVMAYFEVQRKARGEGNVYLAYRDVEALTKIEDDEKARLTELFCRSFDSVEELLAYGIEKYLGKAYNVTEAYLKDVISRKPLHPEEFGYFMDHAFFSAARLHRELIEVYGVARLTPAHLDALSAIMLHNSLYKFAIAFYKSKDKRKPSLKAELHPLAYLLMLCDELQCWDRTAYGRNSRTELHPMSAEFDFTRGMIRSRYFYDTEEAEKIGAYEARYRAWQEGDRTTPPPRLKAYSDMAESEQRFLRDIEKIVDLSILPLTVETELCPADRKSKHTYLSASNFLHMYDFAVALNARYNHMGHEDEVSTEQLEDEFNLMSLEYKLSNINQVKSFARYLNAIGCFYTDKPVDYDMLHIFRASQIRVFAPMEHARWVREHRLMGWTCGSLYKEKEPDDPAAQRALRERLRQHVLCMEGEPDDAEIYEHYLTLSPQEQEKDWRPFNSMLRLIKKFDGLRIYRLSDKR